MCWIQVCSDDHFFGGASFTRLPSIMLNILETSVSRENASGMIMWVNSFTLQSPGLLNASWRSSHFTSELLVFYFHGHHFQFLRSHKILCNIVMSKNLWKFWENIWIKTFRLIFIGRKGWGGMDFWKYKRIRKNCWKHGKTCWNVESLNVKMVQYFVNFATNFYNVLNWILKHNFLKNFIIFLAL